MNALRYGLLTLVVGGHALASPRTLDLSQETLTLDPVPARGEKLYRQPSLRDDEHVARRVIRQSQSDAT